MIRITIRNTKISANTNFQTGERPIASADVNDTNDEIIDRLQDTTSGHDHDGTDSKEMFFGLKFLFTDLGTTTDRSVTELESTTLPAGTFNVGESIMVEMEGTDDGGGGENIQMIIRINDGTNTFDTTAVNTGANSLPGHITVKIATSPKATNLITAETRFTYNDTADEFNDDATMIADWLTAELTISLRGQSATDGTGYYRWRVYRLRVI